ncbi:probable E3 ubiquitin-protein ligase XERICO [Andrographis paniculata]|uniref:probable E3 ubiquitin-protein ligase XERICO n=1 Tax=Andrographis paniculata TaxID=175694 RepID=UPI0021E88889|nr:probable E3 ubiquitin-protein ligase XERICO [Andrographis paniculata]
MAISSYTTPADSGVLFVILANTAMSIAMVKEIVRSILHVIGIRIASWEELSVEPLDSGECHRSPSETYAEELRSQMPAMRYDSIFIRTCLREECPICLTEFEANMEVNRLACSHVFHKVCLEKWLNYWNATCPLCRNHMMPQEAERQEHGDDDDEDDACPMSDSVKQTQETCRPYKQCIHQRKIIQNETTDL